MMLNWFKKSWNKMNEWMFGKQVTESQDKEVKSLTEEEFLGLFSVNVPEVFGDAPTVEVTDVWAETSDKFSEEGNGSEPVAEPPKKKKKSKKRKGKRK